MTDKEYKNTKEVDLVGREVKLLRQIITGGGYIFGVGTTMKIKRKFGGFELVQISICKTCGCGDKRSIHHVQPEDVELLPQ